MSAQSWSVKGIDPKVREAAREAAARQGMSLGEYLNQALANQQPHNGGAPNTPATMPAPPRARTRFSNLAADAGEDEDWSISGPSALPRNTDPVRLAQRLESIERRTQLAVSGLDRAVSTIDRSVLGLAARVEDAEAMSGEAADRIADALEQFRHAGDALAGKIDEVEEAKNDVASVKQRLETQAAVAEEIARRAEAAASYLTAELETRDTTLARTLEQARAVAEEAARQASEASADAVTELRRLQEQMSERLAETETSTRRTIASAIQEVRAEQEGETRSTREALLEEVVRLESEITKRIGSVEEIKTDQSALIARIERAEASARESTAGLRQAAGAAIADLRNTQLTITARLKQVEDDGAAAPDLSAIRRQQQDIAERLGALEGKEHSPVAEALAAFERRISGIETGGGQKLQEVDGAVKSLDTALQRLSDRIAETESTANTAIRTLEETVSSLNARVEQSNAVQETEAVRAMLEQRLDAMAQSVHQTVGQARTELESQLHAALGGAQGEGLEEALRDVNQRLAAAERRQAQTIEAISLEIKRMSETVDKRLRSVEARNDDAAASAVREELTRMSTTLEQRFDEIERREAAGFDRMGLEVGRLSERLEERVGAVEIRSAQAIEHVGEQVARMAERFNQRHDILARDLGERMIDSEDRAGARVAEAIGSIMHRLAEVEQHSAEAIAPVQKAVSSVANKLEQFESAHDSTTHQMLEEIPTPSRRFDDFSAFGEPEPSPMDAAQPVRAAPLPPRPEPAAPTIATHHDDDIYFAEDDLVADAPTHDAFTASEDQALEAESPAPEFKSFGSEDDDLLATDIEGFDDVEAFNPPAQDDDPFWSPEDEIANAPLTSAAPEEPASATPLAHGDFDAFDDDLPLDLPDENAATPVEPPPPPGKNDYLAAARRAAQAQSLPRTRADPAPTPQLSLRGSSRIVLWGAASGIAALLIGGAYFYTNSQRAAQAPHPTVDTHPSAAPAPTIAPPATDATAQDPLAADQPPASAAPVSAAPQATAPGSMTPPASAAPVHAEPVATIAPAVAGPLAPRSVSLEAAAQGGDPVAQYQLALQRLSHGRTADGLGLLRNAANHGLAMAQYRLAKVYERGEGVGADLSTARQWTERAAASGNRRAMHDLGVYYARGDGAPLDEATAFRWFRQAAELGVADSQYNLGVLYQQGRGVQANASESLFWFAIAARQGDTDAAARATAEEAQLTTTQVQQARARAQAFRPRAASAVANGDFGQRPWTTAAAPPTPVHTRH
ncbi:MAG: hypothetical protein WAU68_10505 [Vitreimonas sp.]